MSSDETRLALSRAYELVESGKYEEARAILDPVIADDPENADAWWVYAHAVSTAEDGRRALENVVRIDPRYPGAAELLQQARELAPAETETGALPPPPATMPEAAYPATDEFDDEDELDAQHQRRPVAASEPAREGRGSGLVLAALALVAVVVIVVLLLQSNVLTTAPTPTASEAADVVIAPTTDASSLAATDEAGTGTEEAEPTRRPTITPTVEGDAASTAEAASTGDYPDVAEALAQFPLAENGIAESATTLGNTLLVRVCSAPGREMRMLLPQVMNTLAAQAATLSESVQALGVSLVNCETGTPMLTVATEMVSAQNYAQGDLSDAEFAATWEPQTLS